MAAKVGRPRDTHASPGKVLEAEQSACEAGYPRIEEPPQGARVSAQAPAAHFL